MILTHLDIRRLPGIDRPFALQPRPGVNLIVGPNASGKSSTARAVRDLLWPARHDGGVRWLRAVFRDGDDELTVTCDGPLPAWSRGGAPVPPPALPPAHLADCYRLTATDLLGAANALDRDLAAAIASGTPSTSGVPAGRRAPTEAATTLATASWPSAPMLKRPPRSARSTAMPVTRIGVALKST